jgi:hypothetical protein
VARPESPIGEERFQGRYGLEFRRYLYPQREILFEQWNQRSPSELFHFAGSMEPKHLEKLAYFTCFGISGAV